MSHKTPKLNLFAQVRELSPVSSLAFCACLLERQVPNFRLFCEVVENDDATQMEKALEQLWLAYAAKIARQKFKTNIALLRDKVEIVTPDAADYDNFGVYPAIDCAMAMVAALNVVSGDDLQGAVVLSKLSQGSVESVILATEGELDNQAIKQHPLMQREIDFQQQLVELLTQAHDQALPAQQLKAFALEDGLTNIGIAIDDGVV